MSLLPFIAFLTALIVFSVFAPKTIAYPENQFKECTLAAKANPSLLGVPEISIQGFCDCALIEILDNKKNAEESAKYCIKEFINK